MRNRPQGVSGIVDAVARLSSTPAWSARGSGRARAGGKRADLDRDDDHQEQATQRGCKAGSATNCEGGGEAGAARRAPARRVALNAFQIPNSKFLIGEVAHDPGNEPLI